MSADSFRALCTDHYVNQKLTTKMELPRGRETVLELFERIRRQFPAMSQFRRHRDELALESTQRDMPHRWAAVRATNIRSGTVNAGAFAESYSLHKTILETAPYYLNIPPLDVDHLEVLFGFDLAAPGNHDAIVFEALHADSPLARLVDIRHTTPVECEPLVALSLDRREGEDVEIQFEVKTRSQGGHDSGSGGGGGSGSGGGESGSGSGGASGGGGGGGGEPISVYLTLRRFGAPDDLKDLPRWFDSLVRMGEELIENRVVPHLLVPLREAIGSGS